MATMFAASFSTLKKRASELVKGEQKDEEQQEELGPPSHEDVEALRSFAVDGKKDSILAEGPMIVRYEVPNGDEADREMSAFPLPVASSNGMTVGHVRKHFPPSGRFHFRFKVSAPDPGLGSYVWVDPSNDNEFVPTYRGEICMKALLLPADAAPPRALGTLPGSALASASSAGSFTSPQRRPSSPPAQRSSAYEPPPSREDSSPRRQPSAAQQATAASLFPPEPKASGMPATPKMAQPPAPTGPPADLMDLGAALGGAPAAPPVRKAAAPAPVQPTPPPPAPKVFDRNKLVAEREAYERQRVADAAARQAEAVRQEEKLKADKVEKGNELGTVMDAWAKTPDGQAYKDIKVLLSTMHTVAWTESGWKELPLSELLKEGSVKKWYRKAILLAHPDKQKDADPERQVRADRIFQALNESFKVADV